jgi:hypothetical protein
MTHLFALLLLATIPVFAWADWRSHRPFEGFDLTRCGGEVGGVAVPRGGATSESRAAAGGRGGQPSRAAADPDSSSPVLLCDSSGRAGANNPTTR